MTDLKNSAHLPYLKLFFHFFVFAAIMIIVITSKIDKIIEEAKATKLLMPFLFSILSQLCSSASFFNTQLDIFWISEQKSELDKLGHFFPKLSIPFVSYSLAFSSSSFCTLAWSAHSYPWNRRGKYRAVYSPSWATSQAPCPGSSRAACLTGWSMASTGRVCCPRIHWSQE